MAQARMKKGVEKTLSAAGFANRPSIQVLEYSSRMWISKSDYRRLQNVQTSRTRMSLPIADGQEQIIESSGKATSRYSYQKVVIDVPEDAKKILFGNQQTSSFIFGLTGFGFRISLQSILAFGRRDEKT